MKRLHQALDSENTYSQVAYDYNEEGNGSKMACDDSQSPKRSEGSQEEDQAFVPPADLEIPEGIPLVGKTNKKKYKMRKDKIDILCNGGKSYCTILITTHVRYDIYFSFFFFFSLYEIAGNAKTECHHNKNGVVYKSSRWTNGDSD